jgi:ribosomal protein S18 acetylase RimI-like enzyme
LTSVAVRAVESGEIRRAAELLARAFHRGPLSTVVYADEDERVHLAPQMFEALVCYDHLFRHVDCLAQFAAVATWLPPGDEATPEKLARAGFEDLPREAPLERMAAILGVIGSTVVEAAPERYWHLRLLGVEPACQSGGLGSALLRHGLRRAQATSCPVVLETVDVRTVPFYQRNGFEIIVEAVEPSSGLRFWGLRHDKTRL